MIQAAADRQLQRYESMARAPRSAPQVRSAAEQIAIRIKEASQNLLGLRLDPDAEAFEAPVDIEEETFFQNGVRAMNAHKFDEATQCFKRARACNPGSARNMAHLGWAIFNRTSLDENRRVEQAGELLSLAATMEPGAPSPQWLLAAVDAASGRHDRAHTRLIRLLKRHPNHEEARALMGQVMKTLRSRGN